MKEQPVNQTQIARQLGVDRKTIRRWEERGLPFACTHAGYPQYLPSEVRAWLDEVRRTHSFARRARIRKKKGSR